MSLRKLVQQRGQSKFRPTHHPLKPRRPSVGHVMTHCVVMWNGEEGEQLLWHCECDNVDPIFITSLCMKPREGERERGMGEKISQHPKTLIHWMLSVTRQLWGWRRRRRASERARGCWCFSAMHVYICTLLHWNNKTTDSSHSLCHPHFSVILYFHTREKRKKKRKLRF